MSAVNCSVCGKPADNVVSAVGGRNVYACGGCGVFFLSPQLSGEELTAMYQESYYRSWGLSGERENEAVRRMKTATFGLRLDLIGAYKKSGTILDVGCATGFFLEKAKERGFRPYGVELSPYSCAIARKKLGEERVHLGTLETAPFGEKYFDVINMSDLLEHVRSPRETLRAARRLLKDDGVLVIMTPDTDSLTRRLMGPGWTHYKEEHFFYFNRRSLAYLAAGSGFEAVHFEPAKKFMNLAYLRLQFQVYPHRFLSPLSAFLFGLLPGPLRSGNFRLTMGEMVAVLKPSVKAGEAGPEPSI